MLPPVVLFGALLLQLCAHFVIPVTDFVVWPWNLIGGALIFAGFGIAVYADWQFKRVNTPVHPFHTPVVLVTTGVFAFTRNPMYLGMVAVLVGVAIVLGTVTPWAIPPLFAWYLAARFIRVEEAALSEQFGEAYRAYARRVRRWI